MRSDFSLNIRKKRRLWKQKETETKEDTKSCYLTAYSVGNIIFPVQLTTSRIGNLTRLIHTLLYVMTIHTYICLAGLSMDGHTHIARAWINRARLRILHVVSWNISLSAVFAPENLVTRDGFGSPAPRQPAHLHTQAESGAHLRDTSRVPRRRPFIHFKNATWYLVYVIGTVPSLSGHHAITYRWRWLPRVRRHRHG